MSYEKKTNKYRVENGDRFLLNKLSEEQREFMVCDCQINPNTGVTEDYANYFNWIPTMLDIKEMCQDDFEAFKEYFLDSFADTVSLHYEDHCYKLISEEGVNQRYNELRVCALVPSIDVFAPFSVKQELNKLVDELSSKKKYIKQLFILRDQAVKDGPEGKNVIKEKELDYYLNNLQFIWEQAKKLIYGERID